MTNASFVLTLAMRPLHFEKRSEGRVTRAQHMRRGLLHRAPPAEGPTVRDHLRDLGLEVSPRARQTPEAPGMFHRAEIEKWWPIIKAAGIKAQ